MSYLFIKIWFKEKSLYYFHKKFNIKKKPKNPFLVGFLGGFFGWVFYCQPWRKEPERGIATLDLMREWGAAPDILTFGCLALCCTSYKEAARLMADLKARGCQRNHVK
jgi:hypothetical protein